MEREKKPSASRSLASPGYPHLLVFYNEYEQSEEIVL